MKRDFFFAMPLAVAVLVLSGCVTPVEEEDSPTGEARSAIVNQNALNPLGLAPTGTFPSALTPAMLAPAALAFASLSSSAAAAIQDPTASGDLSRQLLSYTVGCALDSTQSFSFSWVDSASVTHNESYQGLIGLATGWATGPLDTSGQQWVSACLISRVNYLGASVSISSRGQNGELLNVTSGERNNWAYEEGAFWGNVFSSTPTAYACANATNDVRSRIDQRYCAAGYPDPSTGNLLSCGIVQRLGSCDTYCDPLTKKGGYHPTCTATPGNAVWQVVTIFLQ
jgi:hypothetical protein